MELLIPLAALAAIFWYLVARPRQIRKTNRSVSRSDRAPQTGDFGPASKPDKDEFSQFDWEKSDSGNPILFFGEQRLAVFRNTKGFNARGGWKFCLATGKDDDDPYFSGEYPSEEEAKYEGLAKLRGLPSRYDAVTRRNYETVTESHRRFLRNATAQTDDLMRELNAALTDPTTNVTRLRPIERKLETKLRQFHQTSRDLDAVSDQAGAESAKAMRDQVQSALGTARARIAELKTPAKKG